MTDRLEKYRGVLGKLQLNEELAKRRAARTKAQLDKDLAELAEHVARHDGAKKEWERLELEVAR